MLLFSIQELPFEIVNPTKTVRNQQESKGVIPIRIKLDEKPEHSKNIKMILPTRCEKLLYLSVEKSMISNELDMLVLE